MYRDLKPENVLLKANGYIGLTDFGMQRIMKLKSGPLTTFYGTTEYLAPETVVGKEQTETSDWWALGVIM